MKNAYVDTEGDSICGEAVDAERGEGELGRANVVGGNGASNQGHAGTNNNQNNEDDRHQADDNHRALGEAIPAVLGFLVKVNEPRETPSTKGKKKKNGETQKSENFHSNQSNHLNHTHSLTI